jgi:hypothetical protein
MITLSNEVVEDKRLNAGTSLRIGRLLARRASNARVQLFAFDRDVLVFDNFVRKGYHPVWSATGSGLLSSLLLTAESLKAAREIAVSEQEYPRSHPRERWLPCPSDVGA